MQNKGKLFILIGGFLISFAIFFILGFVMTDRFRANVAIPSPSPISAEKQHAESSFSYAGEDGKDALTLLQEKTTIEQEDSGLVSSINGRMAEAKKREFWSFYINGKMSQVGPAEYITKNGDTIEWRIETY